MKTDLCALFCSVISFLSGAEMGIRDAFSLERGLALNCGRGGDDVDGEGDEERGGGASVGRRGGTADGDGATLFLDEFAGGPCRSPVPVSCLVVKKGSEIRRRTSRVMPDPVSAMVMRMPRCVRWHQWTESAMRMWRRPGPRVASIALFTMLVRICWISRRSQ